MDTNRYIIAKTLLYLKQGVEKTNRKMTDCYKTKNDTRYGGVEWTLVGFICLLSISYILISGKRSFNFDEFQVLQASASLLRGKTLYADQIGIHFPLVNILFSFLIYVSGFKAVVLLIARYFIFCINGITLFYIYRIADILWDEKAGLFAVALTLVTVIFMKKGIEIRHDVFNTMFNAAGAYYALKYIDRRKYFNLILSGLFLGLALAATQKAIVWSGAISLGVIIHFFREKKYGRILKIVLTYTVMMLLPLMVCVIYLVLANNESFVKFYKHAVLTIVIGYSPFSQSAYPFPHSRYSLLKILFSQNPIFYIIGIGAIVWFGIDWIKNGSEKIVLVSWTAIGLLFYLTVKRPFYQSFLPTIPPLAVAAGGLLVSIGIQIKGVGSCQKWIAGILGVFFLFLWPFYSIARIAYGPSTIDRQIDNVDFCLDALKKDEKVMCLTQNQIFFDPVMTIEEKDCGKNVFSWDAECFENKMKKAQSKIVIYDYRTSVLKKDIQKKIKDNYVYSKIGEILIPGFKIPPKKLIERDIWIDGYYYTSNPLLIIDGKRVNGNLFRLNQKRHAVFNPSNKPVLIVYKFHPESDVKKNSFIDTYINNMF